MNITRRRLLILLPAAAVAWKYVQAGTPEAAPNYKMTEHWWSMLIDIPKCIGCGFGRARLDVFPGNGGGRQQNQ